MPAKVRFRAMITSVNIQELIDRSGDFIARHQRPNGDIPWYDGGKTDPWDHTECAIALDLCGRHAEAKKAYLWLRGIQNPDGSWWYSYMDGQPNEMAKDTNYSTYIAVGMWCHYLATGDRDFLEHMWPAVEKALEFAVKLQQPTGEIHWGRDLEDAVWEEALTAASSCIWLSLRSGVRIAKELGIDKSGWETASDKLAEALRDHPELFGRGGYAELEYAVSWFYPVLTGVVNGNRGKDHLLSRWDDFVIDNRGCKCVVEEPWWVTVAETAELMMALIRVGERDRAQQLFEWIIKLQDEPGSFWAGIKIPEEMIWPEDKPTWVSAAMVIAASAQLDGSNKLADVLWGKFDK
jgi:GH15 family glucan-1,4-alpha-glucosidase